jgi:hypothetical protein
MSDEKHWVTPDVQISDTGNAVWLLDGIDWHSQDVNPN